jgi:hypothetical protein
MILDDHKDLSFMKVHFAPAIRVVLFIALEPLAHGVELAGPIPGLEMETIVQWHQFVAFPKFQLLSYLALGFQPIVQLAARLSSSILKKLVSSLTDLVGHILSGTDNHFSPAEIKWQSRHVLASLHGNGWA